MMQDCSKSNGNLKSDKINNIVWAKYTTCKIRTLTSMVLYEYIKTYHSVVLYRAKLDQNS